MIEKIVMTPLLELLKDIYKSSKGPLKQGILSCLSDSAQDKRERCASGIANVKTIWQIDKSVNISDFYHPTTLEIGKSSKTIDDTNLLFEENNRIIIEGIAGQGKSIFLRHSAIECFRSKKTLPVFVQLRHISKEICLKDLLINSIDEVGVVNDPIVLEFFLRNGRFTFFLDGFDEINEEFRSETIRFLESYSQRYPKNRIVVSSRPNSDIQHSISFNILKIQPLGPVDRKNLINTLVDDQNTVSTILSSLKDNIANVLTTPLLVTLLVITYKSESEIPEHLSDFYKSLFSTLIKRHDKTKPGYIRERRTHIGNVEFERVFENLSFIALNNYKISMSEREFYSFSKESLRVAEVEGIEPQKLMEDISKITCLILLDGEKYYFLHKSIAEFFAAQKIAEEGDVSLKDTFYKQLRDNDIPDNWYQTLFFLSEIDNYHFTKKLLIPYYETTFSVSNNINLAVAPDFDKVSFLALVGNQAEIHITKYGETYKVSLIKTTKNWLACTYLSDVIEKTIRIYILERASEWELSRLLESRYESKFLDFAFTNSNSWGSFLNYVNFTSPLKSSYKNLLYLRKAIKRRNSINKPMLDLNL